MADRKISQLTAAGALTGTEQIELVQGGASVRSTASAIAALAGGGAGPFDDPFILYFFRNFASAASGSWNSVTNSADASVLRAASGITYSSGQITLPQGCYIGNIKCNYTLNGTLGAGNSNVARVGLSVGGSFNPQAKCLSSMEVLPNSHVESSIFLQTHGFVFSPTGGANYRLFGDYNRGGAAVVDVEAYLILCRVSDVVSDDF